MKTTQSFWDRFWKDKNGTSAILETPNIPLVGWFIFMILCWLLPPGDWKVAAQYLSFGFLFTWAWLELYNGHAYFRRLLGLAILVFIVYNRV